MDTSLIYSRRRSYDSQVWLIQTFLVQGPSILDCDEKKKGLLPRVVDELFTSIKISEDTSKYTIKLSMVGIASAFIAHCYMLAGIDRTNIYLFSFLVTLQVEIYMEKVRFVSPNEAFILFT